MNRKQLITKSETIVIKVGTNLLTTPEGQLDLNNLRDIAYQISDEILLKHKQIVLVSSGAITCGSERLQLKAKTIAEKQAAASVGQILLMHEYISFFEHKGIQVGQILLTKDGLEHPTRRHNAYTTIHMLIKNKILPIINENDSVATNEIQNLRFGDNDELSYLVSHLLSADLLIILTDIDGVYTANPKTNPKAKLISDIKKVDEAILNLVEDIPNERSRGGMKSKISYAKKASEAGIPVIIANGRTKDSIKDIFLGKPIGTLIG